ncbi:MAG: sulfotransferase [Caulobacteraceae bacterium]|nr:sulfotransferase [Caulobacteraceae bacterium]
MRRPVLRTSDLAAEFALGVDSLRRGAFESARRRLKTLAQRHPASFDILYNLAYAHHSLRDWEAAAGAYRAALDLNPGHAGARFTLAVELAILGRTAEAACLYRALAQAPATRPAALARLALLDPGSVTAAEAGDIERSAAAAETETPTRIALWFALGEVRERAGPFDDAFSAFQEGNRLKRATLIDPDPRTAAREHAASIAFLKATFTREFIAAHEGPSGSAAAPIFVVGMPRSGSTLIEQILASHSQVSGLGETSALHQAIGGAWPYRAGAPAGGRTLARLAQTYLASARAAGWRRGRFVDKMLDNYLHVGMIHLLFPRAVILHSVRDPVDTCLSCFRQLFIGRGNECAYDLGDIGAEYVRYRDMMDHWREVLPGRVIDVDHESLVTAPTRSISRLVTEACGLAMEDACLRHHESARPVRSASAAQVRRPISATAVGRWRHYERHLGPLLEALGRYGPRGRR